MLSQWLHGNPPSGLFASRESWPPASFAELAGALANDGIQSVMVGGRADLPVAREIEAALGVPQGGDVVLNLMGTDLPTLAGILSACRALVSNDSGAMHLATALGVPVTAVFGATDERQTGPVQWSDSSSPRHVLTSYVWCRPCLLRECPIDHRCMTAISPAAVSGSVIAQIERGREPRTIA